jgi:hypothetical protein
MVDVDTFIVNIVNFIYAFLQSMAVDNPTLPSGFADVTMIPPIIEFNSTNPATKQCAPGFVGRNCDIECGMTNFEQNQKIVGGK